MYKRVSIALARPQIAIPLRLITLILLGGLALAKIRGLPASSVPIKAISFEFILIAGLLSVFNLGVEAWKYRELFGRRSMSFSLAYRSVLSGMAVGIWTPNRVGEVIGRVKAAPPADRKKAFTAGILGSFLQGSATLFCGCFALIRGVNLPSSLHAYAPYIYIVAGMSLVILLGLSIFRKRHSTRPIVLIRATFLAFSRYFIFTTQFAFVLFAFGFTGSAADAFFGIGVIYLLQSFVPGSFLSELGIREVLSILIFSDYFDEPMAAPLAAFIVWVINIGMPIVIWAFTKQRERRVS